MDWEKIKLGLALTYIIIAFTGLTYILVDGIIDCNKGHNEYWFERFGDGEAEKVCSKYNMSVGMQNPSKINCYNGEDSKTVTRHLTKIGDVCDFFK